MKRVVKWFMGNGHPLAKEINEYAEANHMTPISIGVGCNEMTTEAMVIFEKEEDMA